MLCGGIREVERDEGAFYSNRRQNYQQRGSERTALNRSKTAASSHFRFELDMIVSVTSPR